MFLIPLRTKASKAVPPTPPIPTIKTLILLNLSKFSFPISNSNLSNIIFLQKKTQRLPCIDKNPLSRGGHHMNYFRILTHLMVKSSTP